MHTRRLIRRLALWGAGLAVVGGLGWLVWHAASGIQLPASSGRLAVPVSASDHALGRSDAPITLVEYSDYQCPACGAFYPIVQRLLAEPDLKDKVRFVYRNFPLTQLHANAQLATQAAEAAALQGKFWQMHDKLFEGQSKWSGMSGAGTRAQFMTYATELGLDAGRFAVDIDSSGVKDKIANDLQGGLDAGVDSTPTFFVNSIHMPSPSSYEQFKQYVTNGIGTNP